MADDAMIVQVIDLLRKAAGKTLRVRIEET
jgi:hypothetical protein